MKTTTVNTNETLRIVLLLSGAFMFAYCFGIVIHELGHVLAYRWYGVPTKTFVIHPFGRNYMEPTFDISYGTLLVFSSGSLFNVICAVVCSIVLRRAATLFLMPFFMWASTALIQESIAMILDIANGGTFDWSMVVAAGIPGWLVACISALFLILGSLYFLRLIAFAGLTRNTPFVKVFGINLVSVVPYFLLALIYASTFQKTMMFAKSVPLLSSICLSLVLSVVFRPTYAWLERAAPDRKFGPVTWTHAAWSFGLALLIVLIGLFFFN